MALNEYDAMLSGEVPARGNEYDALLANDKEITRTQIAGSMLAASQADPDRRAKAFELSKRTQLPIELVERNFEELSQKYKNDKPDYDSIINKTPKLAEWLKDPNNAALSADDLKSLGKTHQLKNEFDEHSQLYNAVYSGLNIGNQGLMQVPAFLESLYYAPANVLRKVRGQPQIKVDYKEGKLGELAQWYGKAAEQATAASPDLSEDIVGRISAGDYAGAGRSLALKVIQNAPNQVFLLGSALMGMPAAGLAQAGLTTGAQEAAKLQEQGAEPLTSTLVGGAHGAIESAFESLGTLGVLKTWEGAIAKQWGKQVSREVMKDMGKTVVYSFLAEGNEEALTSLAQDFTEYVSGVNPDAMKGAMSRALEAGLIGGVSGVGMTSPAGVAQGVARMQQVQQTRNNQAFYLAIGENANESKLRERLPEKYQDYVKELTKDGPVENVYIPLEALESYFQEKSDSPVKMAGELGILQEYEAAKETGADVKISTAKMAAELAGTEHYKNLSRDIKFSPEEMTANELIKAKAEVDARLSEEQARQEAEASMAQTSEQEAREIRDNVTERLVALGVPKREATAYAQIHGEFSRSVSRQLGVTPKEFYSRYGVRIGGQQVIPGTEPEQAVEQVYEQTRFSPTYDAESGKIQLRDDNVRISGEMVSQDPAAFAEDFVNPEGVYAERVDVEALGLDKFTRPFELASVEVDKAQRRQGLGAEAVRAIEIEARKQGADVMYVNASPTGTTQKSEALSGLIKFYEKQGFKVLRQSEANAEMYKPLPSAEYNQTRLDTIKTLEQNKANLEKEGFTFWVSEDPYFNEEGEEIEGPALGEEGSRFSVYAQDPLENDIAIAKFKIEDGELVPDDGDGAYEAVNVDASFRRKGIATELYRLAAETSGKPVSNKNRQTDGGKAFREALRDLAPETFYQDRPNLSPLGFYSQVERSIEGMDFKEMPAKDLANRIKNIQGIKKEELEWLGLEDWLNAQAEQDPKAKVSKEQVLEFVRANQVHIQDITYSEAVPEDGVVYAVFTEDGDFIEQFADRESADNFVEQEREAGSPDLMVQKMDYTDESVNGPTRYHKYTTPGEAYNYREILFTFPEEIRPVSESNHDTYRSRHWGDVPNVLAHLRVDERMSADGKRVLMVNEIQSDLHQEGRKYGYRGDIDIVPEETLSELREARKRYKDEMDALTEEFRLYKKSLIDRAKQTDPDNYMDEYKRLKTTDEFKAKDKEIGDKHALAQSEHRRLINEIATAMDNNERARSTVPEAPLKKTWHEFVFKRAIRMAAEEGFDKIAWTTGEQQLAAYPGLEKSLSKVIWKAHPGKKNGVLVAYDLNDNAVIERETSEDKIDSFIGKGPAKRLIESQVSYKTAANQEVKEISGDGLKVGGEGMKGFYDKILPDFARKFAKKFGAKVGSVLLLGESNKGEWSAYPLPNELAGLFDVYTLSDDGKTIVDSSYPTLEEAQERAKRLNGIEVHSIELTPELKKVALEQGFSLFQPGQDGPLGKIEVGNASINIELLKGADRSTFLHETGHFMLEVMKDLASQDNIPDDIKKDAEILAKWLGVESLADVKREQHEHFARAFEAYLMEGKAPSEGLRKAFAKFKAWLTDIYKSLRGLNVELTDEVRDVFDRLLASEEEIATAKRTLEFKSIFGDPSNVGMNEKQQLEYLNAMTWAEMDAKERLDRMLLQEVQRKQESAYRKRFNELYKEEMAKAKEMLPFKVWSALRSDLKLSRPLLQRDYSPFIQYIPKQAMIVNGGENPDVVAQIFGYENGQHMLQEIIPFHRGIDDYVGSEVATRLRAEHPELLESPELSDEAIRAFHNDNYKKLKRMELEYLATNNPKVLKDVANRLIRRMLPDEAVKSQARQIISKVPVRDIRPHQYRLAERRFAREAADNYVKGEFALAFEAKQRELLNIELYLAAMEAKDEVGKAVDKFKKLFRSDETMAKSYDMNLLNVARSVLALHDLGRTDKTAEEHLAPMQKYDPEMYQNAMTLLEQAMPEAGPVEYKYLTFDQFLSLRDGVFALSDLARSAREIEIDGKRMNTEDLRVELMAQASQFYDEFSRKQYYATKDKWGLAKDLWGGMKASLVRIEHWADAMDAKSESNPFRRYIFQPVSEAVTTYRLRKIEVLTRYRDLLRGYEKDLTRGAIAAPELSPDPKFAGFRNKAELMMAVLHSGNDSNLYKLLVGRGWGVPLDEGGVDRSRWDAFMGRMYKEGVITSRDMDFAQSVWDLLESIKPDAQKAHKKIHGYYFNEITAQEIATPFGTYRGGYVPAKVDVSQSEDAAIRAERQAFDEKDTSFQFPTTGRGFTKSRVETYAAPLSLDMSLLGAHMDAVLRFSFIEPTVRDVARIMMHQEFRTVMGQVDPSIVKEAVIPWLQRAAQQKVVHPSEDALGRGIDRVARFLRSAVGRQIMVANVANSLQQFTGLVMGLSLVKPRYIRNALVDYLRGPKAMVEANAAKSDWLKSTQESNIFEIHQSIEQIIVNPSTFEKVQDFSKRHAYFMQIATQNVVNTIVWRGAYTEAIESGKTEREAVRASDAAVRKSQGSMSPEDVSRFETGTATALLFKQFVGYFNMLANLNSFEAQRIAREMGINKGKGKLFYLYLTGFAVPAILSEAIMMAMSGKGLDQDDDDEYLDDMLALFFGSQTRTALATLPYGGQTVVATMDRFTKGPTGGRLGLSPAISTIDTMTGVPAAVLRHASKGEVTKAGVRDALMAMGIITGLPLNPLSKPVRYMMDVKSGNAEPTGPFDFTRGLVTGKPGK